MGPLSFPHACRCSASFPQGGALWMNAGSDRQPGGSGAGLTPFQWEILFSKKLPTSHCRLESVARPFLLSLPSRGRTENKGGAEVCCSVWPGRSCVGVDAHRRQNKREGGQKRKEEATTTTTNSSKSLQVADRTVTARLSIHKPLVSPEPRPTPPCLWRHTRRWMSPLCELWWVTRDQTLRTGATRWPEMSMTRRYLRDDEQGVSVTGLRAQTDT